MLKKSLLKISLVSLGNIFNAILGFLFLTAVARTLSIEDFGKYALLTTLLIAMARVIDFGTNSLFVAKSIIKDTENVCAFLTTKVILFILSAILSIGILAFLKIHDPQFILIFILGLAAYGINFTLFALFQKQEMFNQTVLLNTIPAIIKTLFALGIFLKLLPTTLSGTFAVFALSIFGSSILYTALPQKFKALPITIKDSWLLIKQALPAGISQLINEGWPALTNSIIKILQNFANVGIFSLASKIAQIFSLISLSIFTVLLPKNAAKKKDNKIYGIKESLALSGGVIALAALAVLISKPLVLQMFGEKFRDSIYILNILIFASAATAIHTFMENFFFVEGKTKTLLFITGTKLVVFGTVCANLVPNYSLKGLAWAQLIASIVALYLTGTQVASAQREIHR